MPRGRGNAGFRPDSHGDPPWLAWPERGPERRIKWIETYCRLPKGYGAGEMVRLAPFQKQWLLEVGQPDVRAAVMEVPRGNGKSTFLAAVALSYLYDPPFPGAPRIPVVATTISQVVQSVYGVAEAMVVAEPELDRRTMIFRGMGTQRLEFAFNNGQMFPKSNDKDGLQGLDPSLAVCDEIGFMPQESWDSLLLASGKTPGSLVVGIGTPGFDRQNALWNLREMAGSGTLLPGFHFTEYAADEGCDIRDEDQWRKANPALEQGYMDIGALRMAVELSPEAHFRIFRLGQWVDGVESWLGTDGRNVWDALAEPFDMSAGVDTFVGVDIGLEHDSSAVVWCQRRPDGRFHVKSQVWMPSKGQAVDVTDVMQFLRNLTSRLRVRSIAFDPRLFDVPAKQLEDERLPMLRMDQSLERMSPAAGQAYEMIMRGEITHDGDDQFTWQVLNAVPRFNERGFMLSRTKSKDKIDACVAMLMALAEAVIAKPKRGPSASFAGSRDELPAHLAWANIPN